MKCACGNEIPAERLAILPNTKTCVACSQEKPKKGAMVWGHKTGAALVVVDGDDKESLRRLQTGNSFIK